MPDDQAIPGKVSLEVPGDMLEAYDKLAAALERPREWVMLRALREYLEDGEGAEIAEDSESLAELDRGEYVSADDLHEKLARITARATQQRAHDK
ncbi:MAG: CopG family ribbon-helix-helix protein [Alphaproteobacteria bacterium]